MCHTGFVRADTVVAVQQQAVAAGVAGTHVHPIVARPHVRHLALVRRLRRVLVKVWEQLLYAVLLCACQG